MKASLNNYRQAPRKVRLVANLIKGKRLTDALTALTFLPKKASLPLKKLLESAASNAAQKGVTNPDLLKVKDVRVDKGYTIKRSIPRARGRATPIHRHNSHVVLELEEVKS